MRRSASYSDLNRAASSFARTSTSSSPRKKLSYELDGNFSDQESTYDDSLSALLSWEAVTGSARHEVAATAFYVDAPDDDMLQTVLIALLRGKLENLPDSKKNLLGDLNVDGFLAFAKHPSEMHRVALIRVRSRRERDTV